MIEQMILQILGIILVGDSINKLLIRKFSLEESKISERIIKSIILGYASIIIPMTLVGVLVVGKMSIVVYLYFIISLILVIKFVFKLLSNLHNYNFSMPKYSFGEKIFILLIFGISLNYLFISLIYNERGWDALHIYFPNALNFYLQNGIPSGSNPLSFFPNFKPPFNSLYITYSLFVSNGSQSNTGANLHPWILLMGTLLLVINLTRYITKSPLTAYFGGLAFLVTPLTYFMVYEYAFYQDIPVMFFMLASFYFISKVKFKSKENAHIYYIILSTLSASLAILSKISGFTIILLIFFSFTSFPPSLIYKKVKITLFSALVAFLSYNAALDKYVGYSIVILLVGLYLIKIISKNDLIRIKSSSFSIFGFFPVITILFWLWFMNKIPAVSEMLLRIYVTTENSSIIWKRIIVPNQYEIYIENGMSVSFISSILYIFTGSLFGLFWLIPKIYGYLYKFDSNLDMKLLSSMKIYSLTFFMIWLTYFGDISARYLTPILPMLIIFTCIGFEELLSKINIGKEKILSRLLFLTSATLFYYPFIPIENINKNINTRIFLYHKNQIPLLIYVLVFSAMLFWLVKINVKIPKKQYRRIAYSFSFIFIILFASPQIYLFAENEFDMEEFNVEANYSQRQSFQDLISEIITQNIAISDVILSVNTPGLEYYVTRPVADLMFVSLSEGIDNLRKQNETEAFRFMTENNIELIVKLKQGHVYYSVYEEKYASLSLLQVVHEGSQFTCILENVEFQLFLKI